MLNLVAHIIKNISLPKQLIYSIFNIIVDNNPPMPLIIAIMQCNLNGLQLSHFDVLHFGMLIILQHGKCQRIMENPTIAIPNNQSNPIDYISWDSSPELGSIHKDIHILCIPKSHIITNMHTSKIYKT